MRQLPKVLLFFYIFAENCMKMKSFGPPLALPMVCVSRVDLVVAVKRKNDLCFISPKAQKLPPIRLSTPTYWFTHHFGSYLPCSRVHDWSRQSRCCPPVFIDRNKKESKVHCIQKKFDVTFFVAMHAAGSYR